VWDAVAERVQALLADSVRWTGGNPGRLISGTGGSELGVSATRIVLPIVDDRQHRGPGWDHAVGGPIQNGASAHRPQDCTTSPVPVVLRSLCHSLSGRNTAGSTLRSPL